MRDYLRTERLRLRRITPEDLDHLLDLNNDPEVMRYLNGGAPTTREAVRDEVLPSMLAYYHRGDEFGYWAAEEHATGTFVGWFHFRPPRHAAPHPVSPAPAPATGSGWVQPGVPATGEPGVAAPGVAASGVTAPGVTAPGVAAPGVTAPGGHGPALRRIELGYRLNRKSWGRGYATEGAVALIEKGFTELGVDEVYAETMAVNLGSRRVMEKAGLRYVRTFHGDWPDAIPGSEHGEVVYALTRADWQATRGH